MPGVLITGVSRRRGIAAAVANRLRSDGRRVFTAGFPAYDAEEHSGDDDQVAIDAGIDLGDPDAPAHLVAQAVGSVGTLSALVIAHTCDSGGGISEMTAETIDRHLAVNVRATLLLIREFAAHVGDGPSPARIVLFTSGPPQRGAVAYAASKGALEWITYSAAAELGPRRITVNAINPGPTQTGWMTPEVEREAAQRTPLGRAGTPGDAARVVAFLLSDDAAWLNGQVITADGGHRAAAGSWPR